MTRPVTDPARVQRVIDRLVREGVAVARLDGRTHTLFPVAIDAAEGVALRDRVVREAAVHTIEIGLGYGLSALHICAALLTVADGAARHVVVDPHQARRFSDLGLQVLADAGVAHLIEHHPQDSALALPQLLAAGRRFDAAFVDGNHRFDGVFVDLVHLGRLVRPAGIVFLDDYQLPAVARAAAFFVNNLAWTIEEVSPPHPLHRWAVLRTSSAPDNRAFDHFIDF